MAQLSEDYDRCFEPSYDPNEWAYCKRVSDEDARRLAEALSKASGALVGSDAEERVGPTVLGDDLEPEELHRVNAGLKVVLDGFVEFAFRGGFAFAWDD
jgi:hypothetical protein